MSTVEALLRRDRVLTAVALAALTVFAWIYVWRGAGLGMSALEMTKLALFPHTHGEPMPDMVMPAVTALTVVAMWWAMMIAMMTPSAAPLVLLYLRVLNHDSATGSSGRVAAAPMSLVVGYLFAWLVFSVVATALQYLLRQAALISDMMLWSKSAALSAAILLTAGAYQLSPLKRACLRHCNGPVDFLRRRWRPGSAGAFVMGLEHGAWCVGCCWMLMLLLFIGGVMNLAWIAVLALLVLAERLPGAGPIVSRVSGIVLIVWGLATLVV